MRQRARVIGPLLLLAVLIGAGLWWWNQRASAADVPGALSSSGTIEAEEVLITAEVGGRVRDVLVEEGQAVRAGQVLAQLDTALLEAQLEQARAGVMVAEANLAQLKAGARAEEIAAARAQLEQARAARDGAAKSYEHARRMLTNPQDLEAQVAQARAARDAALRALEQVRAGTRPEDIAAAEAALAQARANAQANRDRLSAVKTQAEAAVEQAANALRQAQQAYSTAFWQYQHVLDTGTDPIVQTVQDPQSGKPRANTLNDFQKQQYQDKLVAATLALHTAEEGLQQAQVAAEQARQAEITGVQAAEAQVAAAEATLARLRNGPTKEQLAAAETALANAQRALDLALATRDNPQHLQAAADAAEAQLAQATAQVAQAEARLEMLQAGARPEQIQAAEAQLAQARAAQHQIEVQLGKATLTAPRDGIVLSQSIHVGEQANPGTALLTIGTLDPVRLVLYISEPDLGRVRLGQQVAVTVDSFPGRIFTGTVTFIAQEAQFTPRNVQTRNERVTTVFAVRVDLPNADHALKPGMPADATIVER